jgi:hypothetical protein
MGIQREHYDRQTLPRPLHDVSMLWSINHDVYHAVSRHVVKGTNTAVRCRHSHQKQYGLQAYWSVLLPMLLLLCCEEQLMPSTLVDAAANVLGLACT